MFERRVLNLLPYDQAPDPKVVQRLSPSIVAVRRQHPETGQLIVAVGTNHMEKPGSDEAQIVFDEFQHFKDRARTHVRPAVSLEGRTPPVRHMGLLIQGERLPEVSTTDLDDAMLKHSGVGLVSCLAVESGFDLQPFQNDRKLILQLEKYFPRDLIFRYLAYRQVPQYFRIEEEVRPGWGDYMRENVALRYARILQPEWDGFDFSLERVMGGMSYKTMNAIGKQIDEREGQYLFESVGHMLGMVKDGGGLTPVQKVSEAYHTLNEAILAQHITNAWGEEDTPDRFYTGGQVHIHAISGILATHGIAV